MLNDNGTPCMKFRIQLPGWRCETVIGNKMMPPFSSTKVGMGRKVCICGDKPNEDQSRIHGIKSRPLLCCDVTNVRKACPNQYCSVQFRNFCVSVSTNKSFRLVCSAWRTKFLRVDASNGLAGLMDRLVRWSPSAEFLGSMPSIFNVFSVSHGLQLHRFAAS
jgi:hypothetical protein